MSNITRSRAYYRIHTPGLYDYGGEAGVRGQLRRYVRSADDRGDDTAPARLIFDGREHVELLLLYHNDDLLTCEVIESPGHPDKHYRCFVLITDERSGVTLIVRAERDEPPPSVTPDEGALRFSPQPPHGVGPPLNDPTTPSGELNC